MTNQSGRPTDDAVAMMRYDANKKSVIVTYLLWFFLGMFGVHRFYLGKWVSGFILLILGSFSYTRQAWAGANINHRRTL